jgi:hypothetical protein
LWKREQLDLVELARLRWVERWRYERLAEYFDVSRSMVRDTIRRIKADPKAAGLRVAPGSVRGF